MTIIDSLNKDEIPELSNIWNEHFSREFGLPTLDRTVTHLKIRDEKGLIGFGMVKLWAEAIMILDLNRPKLTQAKTMKILMNTAIEACKHYNIEQLYATTFSNTIADLCRDHYDFKDFPRIVLVKEL